MGVTEGEIKYILFYITFITVVMFLSSFLDITIMENLTEDEIEALRTPPSIVLDAFNPIGTVTSILEYMNYFITVFKISTTYQLLGLFMTPFTIVFILIILKHVREALPFI